MSENSLKHEGHNVGVQARYFDEERYSESMAYLHTVQYAENNRDLALFSINSFQRDLVDRSQLARTSALRAIASIRVLEVIQLVVVAVKMLRLVARFT